MREPLTAEYLEHCRLRANRYMGQWTGTFGTMAADIRRLLWEIERLKDEAAVLRAQRDDRLPYWLQAHD